MPTYEYECAACGVVEVFQSMRDDPLQECPNCQNKEFKRMISGGAGVIFKGDGFYETDYNRSSDYSKKSKAESSGGSAAKSESKGGDTKSGDSASSSSSGSSSSSASDSSSSAKSSDS